MVKNKIDLVKLNELLRTGKSLKEIAEFFQVSDVALWRARKKLKNAIVKDVVLESGHKVLNENLDAIEQLAKINRFANELLELLMRWSRGEEEALQILESQVRKVKIGRGESAEEVKEYRMKDPRELALKAMAEIRGQLSLQLDIMKTLYDVKDIADFQRAVIETIGRQRPEVRVELIDALKAARALRLSAQVKL